MLCNIEEMILLADLKVLLLSDITVRGRPLRAENHLKHQIKESAVMSKTSSRWIALVTQQVNKEIHTFVSDPFRNNGPA